MPITGGNFVDALIVERDKLKAELTASQDALARANRFQELAAELFTDPIKAIVRTEMRAYADDFDIQGGYRSALKALRSPQDRPTGVVAGSDEIALGVLMAATELGLRVPADLSIIGIDGHPLGETFGITTMNQHPATQGAMAVSQALAQLGGGWDENDDAHLELQVDLKVRGSTARPPSGPMA